MSYASRMARLFPERVFLRVLARTLYFYLFLVFFPPSVLYPRSMIMQTTCPRRVFSCLNPPFDALCKMFPYGGSPRPGREYRRELATSVDWSPLVRNFPVRVIYSTPTHYTVRHCLKHLYDLSLIFLSLPRSSTSCAFWQPSCLP